MGNITKDEVVQTAPKKRNVGFILLTCFLSIWMVASAIALTVHLTVKSNAGSTRWDETERNLNPAIDIIAGDILFTSNPLGEKVMNTVTKAKLNDLVSRAQKYAQPIASPLDGQGTGYWAVDTQLIKNLNFGLMPLIRMIEPLMDINSPNLPDSQYYEFSIGNWKLTYISWYVDGDGQMDLTREPVLTFVQSFGMQSSVFNDIDDVNSYNKMSTARQTQYNDFMASNQPDYANDVNGSILRNKIMSDYRYVLNRGYQVLDEHTVAPINIPGTWQGNTTSENWTDAQQNPNYGKFQGVNSELTGARLYDKAWIPSMHELTPKTNTDGFHGIWNIGYDDRRGSSSGKDLWTRTMSSAGSARYITYQEDGISNGHTAGRSGSKAFTPAMHITLESNGGAR